MLETKHKTPFLISKMSSAGTSIDKISTGTYISLHFPSESPAVPTSDISHTPAVAEYKPVINSPHLQWKPVLFVSCQIPLIMNLQLACS